MSDLCHLLESIRPIAESSREKRIAHLRTDRWIDYPRASYALQRLEELLSTPPRTRMPCLLIHGDSGMGKTMLLEKFKRSHHPTYNKHQGLEQIEIIPTQMPPRPTERRIYGGLLQALGAPFRPSDRLDALEFTTMALLRRLKPKMIVVDEVHHVLAGTPREQRTALNLLKFLSNDLHCCIVALGTHDALVALQSDAQIASRFASLELPRWKESDDLRRFLTAFEKTLPLRERSNLAERELVQLLLAASDGITGRLTELVVSAARQALQSSREQVSAPLVQSILHADSTAPV